MFEGAEEEKVIKKIKSREPSLAYGSYISHCDLKGELPQDYYFRDAWEEYNNNIVIDMNKARNIHINNIRIKRNEKLKELSGSEKRLPIELENILSEEKQAQLQKLRDIPQTLDLSNVKTPESLKKVWPEELK